MAEALRSGNGPGPPISPSPTASPALSTTYSEKLKTNVRFDQRLKRNILEILHEKERKDAELAVGQEDLVRVFRTFGINIETEVTGWQIQH